MSPHQNVQERDSFLPIVQLSNCQLGCSNSIQLENPEQVSEFVAPFKEAEEENRQRFEIELEFVQSLCQPAYLHWLGEQKYFNNIAFVNYLRYLQYWCRPPYNSYLQFPICLRILKALSDKEFRNQLDKEAAIQHLTMQIQLHWLYFDFDRK